MSEKEQSDKAASVSAGVVLLAFGKAGYKFAAGNLAISIKHYSPDVKILCITDSQFDLERNIGFRANFIDKIIEDPSLHKGDPAFQKLRIYKHILKAGYKHNLYIDVDSICLKDIRPLITKLIGGDSDYQTMINATYKLSDGDYMPEMVWGTAERVWSHFNLSQDAVLPACNSSFQYIRKGDVCAKIFKTALKEYENRFPSMQKEKWGGTQPDELYLNVSFAKLNIVPDIGKVVFAPIKNITPMVDISRDYFFLTIIGPKRFVASQYVHFYDSKMEAFYASIGQQHRYKMNDIYQHKHVQ